MELLRYQLLKNYLQEHILLRNLTPQKRRILPIKRNDTVKRIEKAQESAKRRHDNDLSTIEELKKGDFVLVYKASQQHSKSHKLHPKWKGPFVVQVLEKGVFKLRSIDGK
ncbi:18318_t:CDS:2, partial [Dentiscutata erythropus]